MKLSWPLSLAKLRAIAHPLLSRSLLETAALSPLKLSWLSSPLLMLGSAHSRTALLRWLGGPLGNFTRWGPFARTRAWFHR